MYHRVNSKENVTEELLVRTVHSKEKVTEADHPFLRFYQDR